MLRVPDALLSHLHLGKSAKLLWIVLQQINGDAATVPGTRLLQARSGLARHTVLRALADLRARGWLPQGPDRGCAAGQAQQAGASLNTAKRAIRALQATGWLELSQRNKFSPNDDDASPAFLVPNWIATAMRRLAIQCCTATGLSPGGFPALGVSLTGRNVT